MGTYTGIDTARRFSRTPRTILSISPRIASTDLWAFSATTSPRPRPLAVAVNRVLSAAPMSLTARPRLPRIAPRRGRRPRARFGESFRALANWSSRAARSASTLSPFRHATGHVRQGLIDDALSPSARDEARTTLRFGGGPHGRCSGVDGRNKHLLRCVVARHGVRASVSLCRYSSS